MENSHHHKNHKNTNTWRGLTKLLADDLGERSTSGLTSLGSSMYSLSSQSAGCNREKNLTWNIEYRDGLKESMGKNEELYWTESRIVFRYKKKKKEQIAKQYHQRQSLRARDKVSVTAINHSTNSLLSVMFLFIQKDPFMYNYSYPTNFESLPWDLSSTYKLSMSLNYYQHLSPVLELLTNHW
jgi:hypothetical protein